MQTQYAKLYIAFKSPLIHLSLHLPTLKCPSKHSYCNNDTVYLQRARGDLTS